MGRGPSDRGGADQVQQDRRRQLPEAAGAEKNLGPVRRRRGLLLALLDDVIDEAHQDQVRRGQLLADFLDAPAALAYPETIDAAEQLLPAANLIPRRKEATTAKRRRPARKRQVPPRTEHAFRLRLDEHLVAFGILELKMTAQPAGLVELQPLAARQRKVQALAPEPSRHGADRVAIDLQDVGRRATIF